MWIKAEAIVEVGVWCLCASAILYYQYRLFFPTLARRLKMMVWSEKRVAAALSRLSLHLSDVTFCRDNPLKVKCLSLACVQAELRKARVATDVAWNNMRSIGDHLAHLQKLDCDFVAEGVKLYKRNLQESLTRFYVLEACLLDMERDLARSGKAAGDFGVLVERGKTGGPWFVRWLFTVSCARTSRPKT